MACNRNTPFNRTESVKVNVVNAKGEVTNIEVKTKLSVDRIKFAALTNFIGDEITALQTVDKYRIVSICKKRTLFCEKTIRDEGIQSGDFLLLLENSPVEGQPVNPVEVIDEQDDDDIEVDQEEDDDDTYYRRPPKDAITVADIIEATKTVRMKNFRLPPPRPDEAFRPLLITLVDFASTLLKDNPEMEPILKDIEPYSFEELAGNQRRAFKRKTRTSGNESDESEPPLKNYPEKAEPIEVPGIDAETPMEVTDQTNESEPTFGLKPSIESINPFAIQVYPKVPAILDAVDKHKRSHFRPDPLVFDKIKVLGYEDEEIIETLWKTHNKQDIAVDWLSILERPKLNELSRGLPYDHAFMTELLTDPYFIVGLMNPRNFLAIIAMITGIDLPDEPEQEDKDPDLDYLVQEIHRVLNPGDDDGT